MQRKVIDTGDGSKTIFIPEMDEQYHSVNGAFTESEYVFIEKGYLHHKSGSPVVFEVGFGTGLNALLTALKAEKQQRKTSFVTIEKYPLPSDLVHKLNYGTHISEQAAHIFRQIHSAPWNKKTRITECFELLKIEGDLCTFSFKDIEHPDIIYFDAFGPDKQPAMWTTAIFKNIFEASAPDSVFVTYSAKGQIRRNLRDCGYSMERLPGPPGKREMLRGTKICT